MKKTTIIMAGMAIVFAMSCSKPEEVIDEQGSVQLFVEIDPETKATLNDGTGAFAFSSGDAIKVHTASSGAFTGTTASNSNAGAFTMASGFPLNQGGIVGFPAGIVTATTTSSITFTLPTEYEYNQVGSTNPNAGLTPVPMMGAYTAPDSGNPKVTLKQAGAVVRFQLRNVKAGTLSFTFDSYVTGIVTLSSVPAGNNGGIVEGSLTGNETQKKKTIKVDNVPNVPNDGPAIYITLPVPTGTVPTAVYIVNDPEDSSTSRMATEGSGSALNRATGYKILARTAEPRVDPVFQVGSSNWVVLAYGNLMARISGYTDYTDDKVTPKHVITATASEWKIGGYNEVVGVGEGTGNYDFYYGRSSLLDDGGKWVDLFSWQGNSVADGKRFRGLVCGETTSTSDYFGNVAGESIYEGCWTFTSDKIGNGGEGYTWRPLTQAEWYYLLAERTTSTFDGVSDARFARVEVGGVCGLLLFPKNIGGDGIWDNGTMGTPPIGINETGSITWASRTKYTYTQLTKMSDIGVVFMPVTGFRSDVTGGWKTASGIGGFDGTNANGGSWSSSSSSSDKAYRMRFYPSSVNVCGPYSTEERDRQIGRAVRLARDVDADGTPLTP